LKFTRYLWPIASEFILSKLKSCLQHYYHSIDDGYLQRIASAVPRGSILLIEDIDCAFPSRDAEDEDEFVPLPMPPGMVMPSRIPMARVTMSGILNLMDGVASDDGRIIFATVRAHVFP
jgi:hypothetical protein